MLYNKKPLVQSVVEPTDTNVYWVQVIPNSTDVPIIKTFHNGAWTPITGTPASIQDLLDLKAPVESPRFTGKVYVPSPNGDDFALQAARQGTLDDRVPHPTSSTANKYLRSSDDGTAFWDDINNLNGTNYVMVYGTGTPTENAAELQAAYDAAKKMPRFIGYLGPTSPTYMYAGQTFGTYIGGSFKYYKVSVDGEYIPLQMAGSTIAESEAKSVRTTVIVAPGEYNFGASAFAVNASGINIVSLTGNSDVIISSTEKDYDYYPAYGIKVIADYILIKGIDCKTNTFYVGDSLNNLICEYCIGGDYSFGYGSTVSGTFNNCIAGIRSFGSNGGTSSGTFNNCIGGDSSFGCGGAASGTFNYCTGGNTSFGGEGSPVSGTFNNCIGGNTSFGSYGGTLSGIFNNCIGGDSSFGNHGGTIESTARLYYTRITSGTFPTPTTGGRLILCIDGDNNIVTI